MTVDRRTTHVIGVDLGGTWVRVALFDPTGVIIRRAAVITDREGRPNNVVRQIGALAREVAGPKPDVGWERTVLVIGAPAIVDPTAGVVHAAANLSGWQEVPLRRLLEAEMGCRCLVENDANLAALAEQRQGAGRGVANFAYITVSTGIGSGLILDNHLYRGTEGGAGEFGHMVAVPDGPMCHCGHRGCINAIASGDAIARDAGAGSAADVASAAAAGDAKSQKVLAFAARYLGIALGGLINLLNLDAVALGGGVVGAGDMFWAPMVAAVAEGSWPSAREHCVIGRAQLGNDRGVIGAFELVRDEMVQQGQLQVS
jgi:glucokinase